jgi:hypothetical protein
MPQTMSRGAAAIRCLAGCRLDVAASAAADHCATMNERSIAKAKTGNLMFAPDRCRMDAV